MECTYGGAGCPLFFCAVWLDSIPLVSYVKWEVESSGASARASQTDLKLLCKCQKSLCLQC